MASRSKVGRRRGGRDMATGARSRLTSFLERSPCVADGDDAVLRAFTTSWPIECLAVVRMSRRRWADPVAAYPVKTRSPCVRTLVVCSGGLDSVTLSHKLAIAQTLIHLVSFDYGQRHKKELEYARRCAERLRITHDVVDITDVGRRLTGSALTDEAAVPEGHYAEETMRLTVVPNRNAIMLTIAFGVALAQHAEAVAAAVHGGDHFIYPDCRPSFVDAFATMQRNALDGLAQIAFETPFVHWSKADIVREGARLGVPFAETRSCYKGGVRHCGRCGTCVERREAFDLSGVDDPTACDDANYWLEPPRAYLTKHPT